MKQPIRILGICLLMLAANLEAQAQGPNSPPLVVHFSGTRPAWIHPAPCRLSGMKRDLARGRFNHILKMQDLLASFLQFLGCNRTFRRVL